MADILAMSIGPIASLAGNYLQSIFSPASKSGGATMAPNSGSTPPSQPAAAGKTSPFAQIMSSLQQMQQASPAEYAQVAQKISANLQHAAKTAQGNGNTAIANELNSLASDFNNAAQSGKLPSVKDLAKSAGLNF
ncbi:MAG TPA: hypothetical protein VHW24_09055 [Bryobacteraceae bacterium]|nr:hypothetical protein [Bryobacteraceae bacterium]